MIWFVYLDGKFVGTVIAATEDRALETAREKFPDWGIVEVVCRRR